MNFVRKFLIILVFIFTLVPTFSVWPAFAHQIGSSWEKTVNGYKVDVGYDVSKFISGQSARFDFNIFSIPTNDKADFSDVWVRISQDENTVFAGGIHNPVFGLAGMTFVFPRPGAYNLDVRFEKAEKNIVETSFPITVADDSSPAVAGKTSFLPPSLAAAGGLAAGFFLRMLLTRKK